MSNIELVEIQSKIISMQSEVINELFLELMNHISVEEADKLITVKKINHIAELRNLGI